MAAILKPADPPVVRPVVVDKDTIEWLDDVSGYISTEAYSH